MTMGHAVFAIVLLIVLLLYTVGVHQRRQDRLEIRKQKKDIRELKAEIESLKLNLKQILYYARRNTKSNRD